jgi:negative regulator of sigma E activity
VAGREGEGLELKSRYPGRCSYVIVADCENRFPLAFEVWKAEGTKAVEVQFQEINFSPVFPEESKGGKEKKSSWIQVTHQAILLDHVSEQAGFPVWTTQELPAGFQLTSSELNRVVANPPPMFAAFQMDLRVLHFTYTDGMALFSIMQCPADNPVWKWIKVYLPEVEKTGNIVARKFKHGTGSALLMEMGPTVVLLSGHVSDAELESCAQTLTQNQ